MLEYGYTQGFHETVKNMTKRTSFSAFSTLSFFPVVEAFPSCLQDEMITESIDLLPGENVVQHDQKVSPPLFFQ